MKLTSDPSDIVGKMIRLAGYETPSPGMTERIMNRIEVATLKKPVNFRPIIGLRGWVFIGVLAIMLLILSYILMGNNGSNTGNSLIDIKLLLQKIPVFIEPFRSTLQVPKVLLFGLTGLLLLIGLDYLVSTLKWKKHTANEIKQ